MVRDKASNDTVRLLRTGGHYNADEFWLFFLALSEKTMHLKSEKCVGGKHSKLAAANALGDTLSGEKTGD